MSRPGAASEAELLRPPLVVSWGVSAMVVLALVPAAVGWTLRLTLPPGHTGDHAARWRGPDGAPIPGFPVGHWTGCRGDVGLTALVDGLVVYRTCPAEGGEPAGLGRIDARTGDAELRWPFPAELGALSSTVAVQPGDGGALALVYRLDDNQLVGGVAGPDGWLVLPARLPGGAFARVDEVRWMGGSAIVAITPRAKMVAGDIDAPPDPPILATIGGGADVVPREHLCAGSCNILDGWFDAARGDWRWLIEQNDGDWIVGRDGEPERPASGHQQPTPLTRGVLSAEEAIARGFPNAPPRVSSFIVERGTVTSAGLTLGFPADGEEFRQQTPLGQIELRDVQSRPGYPSDRSQVRIDDGPWHDLMPEAVQPIFVVDGDVIRIVLDHGSHVTVDARGERIDPLDVDEHLRRRGSVASFIDEPFHVWTARAVWYGLPLALALTIGIALARRRPLGPAIAIGATIYVLIGGGCLLHVAALLR